MQKTLFSLIIPVFNAEATLDKLFTGIKAFFEARNEEFEAVFVDDGSHDASWPVLCRLQERHPSRIALVRLARNFGQHNAVLCGMSFVRGGLVITLDDDLQNPPEEIGHLISKQAEGDYDAVYGVYEFKQHGFMRNCASRVIDMIFSKAFGSRGSVTSFRILKRELAEKLKAFNKNSVFLDALIHRNTGHIGYALVRHQARGKGRSGYGPVKLIRHAGNLLFGYTAIPIRISISAVIVIAAVSIGCILYSLFGNPFRISSQAGIAIIVFISALLILSLGIIGEHVRRMAVANSRPPYSIREARPIAPGV
jgi:glycosyltransferase involved in cell wall biosynthesis